MAKRPDYEELIIDGVLVPCFRGNPIGRDGMVLWEGMRLRPSEILASERTPKQEEDPK